MIIKCPTCSTKFRLPAERMKSTGIRVRCSQCNAVFRAGPPGPDDKYARVLARGSSKVEAPPVRSANFAEEAEPVTQAGQAILPPDPKPSISTSSTQESDPPALWESVPHTPSQIAPPESSEFTSSTSEEISRATDPAAGNISDDLFADLGTESSTDSQEIDLASNQSNSSGDNMEPDFQDLFPEMDKALSSPGLTPPPTGLIDSGRDPVFSDSLFINTPEPQPQDLGRQLESEFMEESDSGAPPPLMDNISIPSDPVPESASGAIVSEDSQAVGRIKLNKASQARDGSIEVAPNRPTTRAPSRSRTSFSDTLNVPEPGYRLRAAATFTLLLILCVGVLFFITRPDLSKFPQVDIVKAQTRLTDFYAQFSKQSQSGPFRVTAFVAEPYRLGPKEREVLMIQGEAVNTSTSSFENVVAVVNIVQDGTSVRRTMSPLGLRLDDRKLSQVVSKNDLSEVWSHAKRVAQARGHHKAEPGETREFVFVLWDVPPQMEQSAIYVAFRAGRGTLKQ